MKLSELILLFFTMLIVGFSGYFIGKGKVKPTDPPQADTVTVFVKADTAYKDRNFFATLPGKIDTVYLPDSTMQVIASADTLIKKDSSSIKIKYYYPPFNFFEVDANLKERIIEKLKIVKQTVLVEQPWYDTYVTGAISVIILIIGLLLLA